MTFLTEVVIFFAGFFSVVIIARVLGPEGRGLYALIFLIPGLIIAFGNFGFGAGNAYFTGSKKYKVADIISGSVLMSVVLGILLIIFFALLSKINFVEKFIVSNGIPSIDLWLVVLLIPATFCLGFLRDILRGKGDLSGYNFIRIIEALSEFLFIAIALCVLNLNLFGAVLSRVVAVFMALSVVIILIKRISNIRVNINRKFLGESFTYGGKIYFANAVSFLNYRIDMFLIAIFLNPIQVGFYSIAVSLAEKLFMIPGSFATVLCPKISSIDAASANEFTPRVSRHTVFIMAVLSIILLVLSYPLITIVFGKDYAPAVLPLIVLLPGIIAFGIGGVLASDLASRGKPQFAIYSSIVCLLINIPLNFILIPKLGISGASLASTLAYWADTLVIIFAFARISKKPISEFIFPRKSDINDYIRVFGQFKEYVVNWRLKLKKA